MKKTTKKLMLSRETLRSLEESGDLKKIAGGTQRDTVCEGCVSQFYTCNPTGRNCPTYTC